MKTIADLNAIKEKEQQRQNEIKNHYSIRVGMATCGIAAGAKPVLAALQDELKTRGLNQTEVVPTGCVGVCRLEPMIEVIEPSGEVVTYVKMDEAKARRVISEHIVNGHLCYDLTLDKAVRSQETA